LRRVSLKDKEPVLVNDIKKVRVSRGVDGNRRIVFPELFSDRWCPFFVDGDMLVSSVPNMLGSISDKRFSELEVGWGKWLDEWIKLNRLGIKVEKVEKGKKKEEVKGREKKVREKKEAKDRKDEEEVMEATEVMEVDEEEFSV
jgi:hypothetical protein